MVRVAVPADLPRLVELARAFWAESAVLQSTGEFDEARFAGLWTALLASGAGVIFVLEAAGLVVGALGAVVYHEPYTDRLIGSEMFWFVEGAYRGRGAQLYREFERWAADQECSQLRMVHLVDSMPERLHRFYAAAGYRPAEVHYTKEVQV